MQSEAANELIDREDPAPGKPVWYQLYDPRVNAPVMTPYLRREDAEVAARAIGWRHKGLRVVAVMPISIGELHG